MVELKRTAAFGSDKIPLLISLCVQNAEQEAAQSLCVTPELSVVFSGALRASGNKVCSEVFGSETNEAGRQLRMAVT